MRVRGRQSGYTEAEKIEALVLLLAAGGTCVDDIRVLRADGGLRRPLGRQLPSADRLRHFLCACHDDGLIAQAQAERPADRVTYLPADTAALQGRGRVDPALMHRVGAQGRSTRATLDRDATLQESHKREALPHYPGGRGYQPTAVVCVEQDLVVADEYRDGNVGAGMATLPLIRRAFASLPATVTTFYFRADTACDDDRTLRWLADPQRPDETVPCTEVESTPGDWPKRAPPLRYVALRIQKKQGQLFAAGADTKSLAVVSNRWELEAPTLLHWHGQKAGPIERVPDVTKNEPGAAVPPGGRFGANAVWYPLSLRTSTVLSALKSLALPASLSAARPKRLRFTLFTLAGRLVSHAGRLRVRISAEAEWLAGLIAARVQLALLAQALPAG